VAADAAPPADTEAAPLTQLVIPASPSLQERRPRTLKHGDTFAVFDHNGDALSGPGSPEGLYHRDTRHLSHLYLTVEGARPMLLSSTLRDDNATLTCDLTNPDIHDGDGRLILLHDLIHIRRSRLLWDAACFERLTVRNFDERPRRLTIEIAFEADFADIFEVRGTIRERRGRKLPPEVKGDRVTLGYVGLDDRHRSTMLTFDPAPTRLTGRSAVFTIAIAPQESFSLFLEVNCGASRANRSPRRAFFSALREGRRALRAASSRAASIATSNEVFNEAVRRSISDLYMLTTETPDGPCPYAGIPWFSTVFGRDALITALQTLWLDPALARGVLLHLAANQATHTDDLSDAAPGKILHEARLGEMAELGEVPFRRYYGSVDATPLFVMLAGAYLERTGDRATIERLWPHVEAALSWIEQHGDRDGDGFVEYYRETPGGLVNQGWKDSYDAVFHADGTFAQGPIALVEVQAYVYGAWKASAGIAQQLGHTRRSAECAARANRLREAFDARFFDEELGTYGLALDGEKRLCRVRASNAGHALWTGVALPERAGSVVRSLMGGSSFCGWGVRTVASTEARYNPMSYHNGSVWPHDNALLTAGFARYGFRLEAARIFEGMFAASSYMDHRRLPELFCGFPRQRTRGPTLYPVACIPQAWAAAAPLYMLQACLGLGFNPHEFRITFDDPVMPAFLNEVVLRNLSIGENAADIALRRSGRQVVVDVLERRGPVRVVTTS
jgi:glycogen debranching enzyme